MKCVELGKCLNWWNVLNWVSASTGEMCWNGCLNSWNVLNWVSVSTGEIRNENKKHWQGNVLEDSHLEECEIYQLQMLTKLLLYKTFNFNIRTIACSKMTRIWLTKTCFRFSFLSYHTTILFSSWFIFMILSPQTIQHMLTTQMGNETWKEL